MWTVHRPLEIPGSETAALVWSSVTCVYKCVCVALQGSLSNTPTSSQKLFWPQTLWASKHRYKPRCDIGHTHKPLTGFQLSWLIHFFFIISWMKSSACLFLMSGCWFQHSDMIPNPLDIYFLSWFGNVWHYLMPNPWFQG